MEPIVLEQRRSDKITKKNLKLVSIFYKIEHLDKEAHLFHIVLVLFAGFCAGVWH